MDYSQNSIPENAEIGLDLFAAAWLERWRSFGGVVIVDLSTEEASMQMPMPGIAGHPEIEGEGRVRDWNDGYDTGRWRELTDLINLVPGGKEAVKRHVVKFPAFAQGELRGV